MQIFVIIFDEQSNFFNKTVIKFEKKSIVEFYYQTQKNLTYIYLLLEAHLNSICFFDNFFYLQVIKIVHNFGLPI
jgi:hypothetical protein